MISPVLADACWTSEESSALRADWVGAFWIVVFEYREGLAVRDVSEVCDARATLMDGVECEQDGCESEAGSCAIVEWTDGSDMKIRCCIDCLDEADDVLWTEQV